MTVAQAAEYLGAMVVSGFAIGVIGVFARWLQP